MTIDIKCQKEPWGDGIQIAVFDKTTSVTKVAAPPTMQPLNEAEIIDPTFQLNNQEAQQLMDELWRCGLRPSEGTGSAGSLAATQYHLNDMRNIALALLKPHGVE